MEIVTILVLMGLAAALIAYSVMPKRSDERDAMKRRLSGKRGVDEKAEVREQARAKAAERIVKKATPVLDRLILPVSSEERTQLRAKLIQAGYRHKSAQTIYLAAKTVMLVVCAGGALAVAQLMNYDGVTSLGAVCLGAGLGFVAPGIWLGSSTSSRQAKIRRGLPDILDLLVVSVESGLALDAALKRVGDEMIRVHPDISQEFRIATVEGQMGIPRAEALENMSQRVGLDELRSVVSVITQAERFGTSVAKALRSQSEALRTKRRQAAEEKAQKTAVKLMIPLVLFIFPAMGVVLAGPAAINLMEAFGGK